MDYETFDLNEKRGTASLSVFELISENMKNYDKVKKEQTLEAERRLGTNFSTSYGVDENFNLDSLTSSVFKQRCLQKNMIPFSDELIEKFLTIGKYAVGTQFNENVRGKNIYGTILMADDNGKKLVFVLTISQATQFNEDKTNFSIKLDMLVSGKEWFQLARFDSAGAGHPNYISNGNIAKNFDDIEFAATPHLHINSEKAQILLSGAGNCEYLPANFIEELKISRNNSDPNFFKNCINMFLGFANIKTKVNKKIQDNYEYNKKENLFDDKDVVQVKRAEDFEISTENLVAAQLGE